MTHTETFDYYKCTIHAQVDSLISPGTIREVPVCFKCPRCYARNTPLSHGKETNCVQCGLHLQLFGNALQATIELEAAE